MENQNNNKKQDSDMGTLSYDQEALTRFILSKTDNGDKRQLAELASRLGVSADTLDNWIGGAYPKAFGLFVALHHALLLPLESPIVKRGAN